MSDEPQTEEPKHELTDEEAAEKFGVPGFSFEDFEAGAHMHPHMGADVVMARIKFNQAMRAYQRKMIRQPQVEL